MSSSDDFKVGGFALFIERKNGKIIRSFRAPIPAKSESGIITFDCGLKEFPYDSDEKLDGKFVIPFTEENYDMAQSEEKECHRENIRKLNARSDDLYEAAVQDYSDMRNIPTANGQQVAIIIQNKWRHLKVTAKFEDGKSTVDIFPVKNTPIDTESDTTIWRLKQDVDMICYPSADKLKNFIEGVNATLEALSVPHTLLSNESRVHLLFPGP